MVEPDRLLVLYADEIHLNVTKCSKQEPKFIHHECQPTAGLRSSKL
jgi:hypothetical protein